MDAYTLTDQGKEIVVETWRDDRNRARLLVDGEEIGTGDTGAIGLIQLGKDTGHHVRVMYRGRGKVSKVGLVEKIGNREMLTQFAPPPGSRAARSYAFQQRHPTLYASRHLVINVGGTIIAILGIGALLRALLPKIDLPTPDIDINAPDWLKYLDPWRYLKPLFDWVPDIDLPNAPWLKYVIGFLVAVGFATEEAKRRKKRAEEQASQDETK